MAILTQAKNKIETVGCTLAVSASMLLANTMTAFCDGDWESLKDSSGFITVFDNIGSIYIKWAWFFGGFALLGYLLFKADDKKSAICRNIALGVLGGYIVFGFGGAAIQGFFTMVGDSFGQ